MVNILSFILFCREKLAFTRIFSACMYKTTNTRSYRLWCIHMTTLSLVHQTLWRNNTLESYWKDFSNKCHTIGFVWEIKQIVCKVYHPLAVNTSPDFQASFALRHWGKNVVAWQFCPTPGRRLRNEKARLNDLQMFYSWCSVGEKWLSDRTRSNCRLLLLSS